MYYVYILTNWKNSVLYVGVTNDIQRRLQEHKEHVNDGFTAKYNVEKLVYYRATSDIKTAIAWEKKIKGWTREKKNALVKELNPQWKDLSKEESFD